MKEKRSILEQTNRKGGFKVPEGYFDQLSERVMQQLPPIVEEEEPQPTISLWMKIRPALYMAAMFAGIAFMVKVVNIEKRPNNTQVIAELDLNSSDAIEELALYANIDEYTLVEYYCDEEEIN